MSLLLLFQQEESTSPPASLDLVEAIIARWDANVGLPTLWLTEAERNQVLPYATIVPVSENRKYRSQNKAKIRRDSRFSIAIYHDNRESCRIAAEAAGAWLDAEAINYAEHSQTNVEGIVGPIELSFRERSSKFIYQYVINLLVISS